MKRSCRETVTQVYTFIDGEMTWFHRQRIRWHLRKCPPCEGAFQFERQLKTVIRERSREEAPPELLSRLHAFLRENGVGGG